MQTGRGQYRAQTMPPGNPPSVWALRKVSIFPLGDMLTADCQKKLTVYKDLIRTAGTIDTLGLFLVVLMNWLVPGGGDTGIELGVSM